MIKYKINILKALKDKGYTTTKLRNKKILGEKTISHLRHNEYVSMDTLNLLCKLLDCGIDELIIYVPDTIDD